MRGYPPACSTPATDGMVVYNEDKEVRELRRNILRLILIEHPHSCIVCHSRAECEDTRGGPVKAGRITGCSMCPNREICEIREVSHYLGIAHPPGYPLHTLLGKIFSLVPLGSIAYRVHLLSAFFGALACSMLYLSVRTAGLALAPALAGALALGFSAVFWSQSIIAEVYSLNAFFFLLILWL